MKIKPGHYHQLKSFVYRAMDTHHEIVVAYRKGEITAAHYRWELAHYGGATPWICKTLYPYLNDNHIDTALRKITNTN